MYHLVHVHIMSESITHALSLSAGAISSMNSGNLQQAVRLFHMALKEVNDTMLSVVLSQEDTTVEQPWAYQTSQRSSIDQTQVAFTVFDRFFITIPPTELHRNGAPSKSECEILVATFLYNFALAQHLLLKKDRALRLYGYAVQIVQHFEPTNDPHVRCLSLALANNMAEIAISMRDFAAFEQFRDEASSLLQSTEGFHTKLFATNLTVSKEVHSRPAAAA